MDSNENNHDAAAPKKRARAALRLPLMILGPVLVIGIAAYVYLSGGRYESTDDAYVQTARVAISANIPGRVQEVAVRDNQRVHKGDVLFRLDDASLRIAVEEASAQLASARLEVEATKANYRQRQSDLVAARDTLAFQQREYDRQHRLLASGIASQLQVDRASNALDEARSKVAGVQQQIAGVVAGLGGNPDIALDKHPQVQQAQAQLDRAKLNLSYTVVTAPSDGVVARVEELQVGSYIAASAPVFALVSTDDVWVQANFKEDQLAHMRVGQKVSIQIDSHHGRTFEGHVASLSPGTGSQFSVLPAENATGNWVKVVQRLPIRIEFDKLDASAPLPGGLSANVSVDTNYERHLFGTAQAEEPAAGTAAH